MTKRSIFLAIATALAAMLLFFVRFGYGFGFGDQDELIPYLLQLANPDTLASDWFVGLQTSAFNVRQWFAWCILPLTGLMSIQTAFLAIYVLCWLVTGSLLFFLYHYLVCNEAAAVVATCLNLGIFHKWTLGGNDLVYGMLVPEMIAWPLALASLLLLFRQRHIAAAVLLGLATAFQLLVGLLVAIVVCLVLASFARSEEKVTWRTFFVFGCVFAVCSAHSTLPIILDLAASPEISGSVTPFYVLGPFRNPFHHMALSFGWVQWGKFALLVAAGLVGWMLHDERMAYARSWCLRFAMISLGLCLIGIVFTEWLPVSLVLKLQFYKLTVIVKALAVGFVVGALFSWIPERSNRSSWAPWIAVATMAIAALGFLAIRPGPRLHHVEHRASDLGQAEIWIRENTDPSAIFAIPPSISSFRSNAQRAIVVNYAAFPFRDADMIEWYDRLTTVADVPAPRRGTGIKPILDAAFLKLSADSASELASRYGATHMLYRADDDVDPSSGRLLNEFGPWQILTLDDSNDG